MARTQEEKNAWVREDYRKNPEKYKKIQDRYRKESPAKYLFVLAKRRAKKKKLDFDLCLEDIVLPEKCPYLNIELGMDLELDARYSVDRIDNSKGYIKGNVEVISYRANRLKNNANSAELLNIALRMMER